MAANTRSRGSELNQESNAIFINNDELKSILEELVQKEVSEKVADYENLYPTVRI